MEIAQSLVVKARVEEESIVILSPYNAQVSEIKKCLEKKKLSKITVTTISKSQGERLLCVSATHPSYAYNTLQHASHLNLKYKLLWSFVIGNSRMCWSYTGVRLLLTPIGGQWLNIK